MTAARTLLVLAAACLLIAAEAEGGPDSFAVMLDAGSTGSTVRIYRLVDGMWKQVEVADADADLVETSPGLSCYASDPAKAGPSLAGILEVAKRAVPAESQATTPLWVKATAGLRVLDSNITSSVLGAVKEYLSVKANSPFDFRSAEQLSGTEEAAFGYISLNALVGNPNPSVGMLDMGGASTQVAFSPTNQIENSEFSFYSQGTRRSIFARSYTRFGIDTAIERRLKAIVDQEHDSGVQTVSDPCLNAGFTLQAKVGGKAVNFTGTSDPTRCAQLVEGLMHMDVECLLAPCAMMGRFIPQVSGKFYALAGYFYTMCSLGLTGWGEEKVLTLAEILNSTKTICAMSKDEVLAAMPHGQWKYLENACFGGYHIFYMLSGYGFGLEDRSITFCRKVNGEAADWALGAVIFETQDMPLTLKRDRSVRRGNDGVGTWKVISCVEAVVIVGLLVFLAFKLGKWQRDRPSSETSDCETVHEKRALQYGAAPL